jgi:hypothetical protein
MIILKRDKRTAATGVTGEVNVGANVGASGIGHYDGKAGVTLNIRKSYGTEGVKTALNGQQVDHSLDIPALSSQTPNDIANDFIAYYRTASGIHRRTSLQIFWNLVFLTYCDAEGDMIYRGAAGAIADLDIGAANTVMTSSGTAPQWSTAATVNDLLDPTRTLILTAAGGHGTTTSGGGDDNGLPEQGETTTNKINYWYLAQALNEKVFWIVELPAAYAGGAFTVYFLWTSANGSATNECKFQIKGRMFTDNDALDQASGSAATPGDGALWAQGDLHKTGTCTLTMAGAAAGNRYAYFEVERVAITDGTEISGDVQLLQVVLTYATTSNSD